MNSSNLANVLKNFLMRAQFNWTEKEAMAECMAILDAMAAGKVVLVNAVEPHAVDDSKEGTNDG